MFRGDLFVFTAQTLEMLCVWCVCVCLCLLMRLRVLLSLQILMHTKDMVQRVSPHVGKVQFEIQDGECQDKHAFQFTSA